MQAETVNDGEWALAVHGGAGDADAEHAGSEHPQAAHAALAQALNAGAMLLARGADSLEAVETAVRVLEDAPLFNAARGAVFNAAGQHELDASIMDGRNLAAGAVAAVTGVKNPISLARAVMERSEQVLLAGAGALGFAKTLELPLAEPDYFWTELRWRALERARSNQPQPRGLGTVGAVARDRRGNLAAGTSTGGITNKPVGRIGDSAIIGAGTYASNRSCAVSCTGQGEYFMRTTLARDVAALIEYAGLDLAAAVERAISELLESLGGRGGLIAVDRAGHCRCQFNTSAMYRGARSSRSGGWTAIYRDDLRAFD
jgi:L-asparaginase / beta-aspartyl-peptidase